MNHKNLFVLLSAVLMAFQSFAYPISPRPLRQLVSESQHIIVGYVASVGTTIPKNKKEKVFYGGTNIARIAVKEVLQGNVPEDTIEIAFNSFMVCPAPDHYEQGTWVMAFIDKDKKERQYYTHALSYGSKKLDSTEIIIYKKRVAEMQSILTLKDSVEVFTKTVEWLVACAEQEPTCWEGTYELSPESSFMSYYSRSPLVSYKYGLTPQQMERLKNAFLASSTSANCNFGLVDLIYDKYTSEVIPVLIRQLKNSKDEELWFATNYMERLQPLTRDPEKAEKLIKEYDDISLLKPDNKKLRDLLKEFLALLEPGK